MTSWVAGLTWTDDPTRLVLYALAVFRLTVLVTEDYVASRPRRWVESRGDTWAVFITCPWCVSIWLAAGFVALACLAQPLALILGAVLALSAVAGLLAGKV